MTFEKKVFWTCLLLVLARVALSWGLNIALHPHAPFTAVAMYREGGQDYENLQSVGSVLTHPFSEGVTFEKLGTGARSLGLASLVSMAVFLKLFGAAGLIVMDLVFGVLGFLALYFFLKETGISRTSSAVISALFACAGINKIIGLSKLLGSGGVFLAAICACVLLWLAFQSSAKLKRALLGPTLLVAVISLLPSAQWISEWWVVRPFLTNPVFFLVLGLEYRYFATGKLSAFQAMLVGAGLSYLLQSAPFEAEFVGILLGFIFLRRPAMRVLGWVGISTSVVSLPFIYQRLHENPEVARRLGTVLVDRLAPAIVPLTLGHLLLLLVLILGSLVLLQSEKLLARFSNYKITGTFCALLVLACWLSLPVHWLLFAKVVQIVHYQMYFNEILGMCSVVLLARICGTIGNDSSDPNFFSRGTLRNAALIGCFALSFAAAAIDEARAARLQTGIREDDYSPTYRRSFGELVRTLQGLDGREYRVLGSFDFQVDEWWSIFGPGYLFAGDPAHLTISDAEIEARVISLSRTLGLNATEFNEVLNRARTNVYFLGHLKYQASPLKTFSRQDDYDPRDWESIKRLTIFQQWGLVIPNSEKARISDEFAKFQAAGLGSPRLDVVVINRNDPLLGDRTPDRLHFTEIMRNGDFSVWRRSAEIQALSKTNSISSNPPTQ